MSRAVVALAALAAAGAIAAAAQALRAPPSALARARTGRAVPAEDGADAIALVVERGEYRPNVVHARAATPLRLRIAVHDRSACAARLLVPDLGLDVPLVPGGEATVSVPPSRPGSYVFTCGERMVKGVLVLE